jgi:anaphase-promoting complex subunit 4
LALDRLAASISSPSQEGNVLGQSGEGAGDANMNSILAIADDLGYIHCFLDGTYPLGAILLSSETSTPSLFKHPKHPTLFAHPQQSIDNTVSTELQPTKIEIPLLRTRKPRDLAKLSSTTRELVWYTTRVVREMRAVWFGSETASGARELGPKWIRALETKQKDQFGRKCNRHAVASSAESRMFPSMQRKNQTGC